MKIARNNTKGELSNKDKEHIILLHNDAVTEANRARLRTKNKGSLIGAATGVGLAALAKKYAKNSSDKHALAKGLLIGGSIGRLASEIPAKKKSKKYIDTGRKEIDDFFKADRKTRDSMMENYMPLRLKMKEDKLKKKIQSKDKNFSRTSDEREYDLYKNKMRGMSDKEKEHARMMYLDSDLSGKFIHGTSTVGGALAGAGIGHLAKRYIKKKGGNVNGIHTLGTGIGMGLGNLAARPLARKQRDKYWNKGDELIDEFSKADKETRKKLMKNYKPIAARLREDKENKKKK